MHKYPSIGQYKNVIKTVNERCNYYSIPVPELKFKGTIKLHGTNASIYNVLNNEKIVVQSRHNIITVDDDNHGLAKFVNDKKELFNDILNVIKNDYKEDVATKTAIIYGEWVGRNIQPSKSIGVSKLNKMFVIFNIKLVNNKVDNLEEESNIDEKSLSENEMNLILSKVNNLSKNNIYNIYDFPTYEIVIDMSNPKLKQNNLIEITNNVEKECPFSNQFGVKGFGEGVVWRCVTVHDKLKTDDLIFKVKGEKHTVSNVKTIAEVDTVKVNSINDFVNIVLTENRLNQGIEYLEEQKLPLLVNNLGPFLKWVVNDCFKEESDILIKSNLDKKEVAPSLSNKAKQWFLQKINNNLINDVSNNKKLKI